MLPTRAAIPLYVRTGRGGTVHPVFGGHRPAVADFLVAEALDMTRAVIGERFDAALGRAPRLAEMRERLARRDAIARYVGEGKRPTRLTGSPNEAESLARIRRYRNQPADGLPV